MEPCVSSGNISADGATGKQDSGIDLFSLTRLFVCTYKLKDIKLPQLVWHTQCIIDHCGET